MIYDQGIQWQVNKSPEPGVRGTPHIHTLTLVATLCEASRFGEEVEEGFAAALALSFSSMMALRTFEPRTQPSTSDF